MYRHWCVQNNNFPVFFFLPLDLNKEGGLSCSYLLIVCVVTCCDKRCHRCGSICSDLAKVRRNTIMAQSVYSKIRSKLKY